MYSEDSSVTDSETDTRHRFKSIEDCPDAVICHHEFPLVLTGNTNTATSRIYDNYSCSPDTNESGPEIVYRFTLSESGFLALELSEMASGVDIDIHLLSAADPSACIDRGHWRSGGYLEAGDYWVIADTWVNSSGVEQSGEYTLSAGLTTVDDMVMSGMDALFADDVLYAYGAAWSLDEGDHFVSAFTDFSLHSAERRFWLWNMVDGALLNRYHVAHGENSSSSSDDAYSDQIFKHQQFTPKFSWRHARR